MQLFQEIHLCAWSGLPVAGCPHVFGRGDFSRPDVPVGQGQPDAERGSRYYASFIVAVMTGKVFDGGLGFPKVVAQSHPDGQTPFLVCQALGAGCLGGFVHDFGYVAKD